MNGEVKRIEKSVGTFVGKPVTWTIYVVLIGARWVYRGLVRVGTWVQRRYAAARAGNAS